MRFWIPTVFLFGACFVYPVARATRASDSDVGDVSDELQSHSSTIPILALSTPAKASSVYLRTDSNDAYHHDGVTSSDKSDLLVSQTHQLKPINRKSSIKRDNISIVSNENYESSTMEAAPSKLEISTPFNITVRPGYSSPTDLLDTNMVPTVRDLIAVSALVNEGNNYKENTKFKGWRLYGAPADKEGGTYMKVCDLQFFHDVECTTPVAQVSNWPDWTASGWWPGEPKKAFDGNSNTCWNAGKNNGKYYIGYSNGYEKANIKCMKLLQEDGEHMTKLKLQYRTKNGKWKDQYEIDGIVSDMTIVLDTQQAPQTPQTSAPSPQPVLQPSQTSAPSPQPVFQLPPVSANIRKGDGFQENVASNKWRIYALQTDFVGGHDWPVCELEFFTDLGCTSPVATTGGWINYVRSSWSDSKINRAFDGDTSTCWMNRNNAQKEYFIGYDQGFVSANVRCVKLSQETALHMTKLSLQYFKNNKWKNQFEIDGINSSMTTFVFDDSSSVAPSQSPLVEWIPVANKGSFAHEDDAIDNAQFNSIWALSCNQILRRKCTDCRESHKDIYYKRYDEQGLPDGFDMLDLIKNNWFNSTNNVPNDLHVNFDLFSTYEDAIAVSTSSPRGKCYHVFLFFLISSRCHDCSQSLSPSILKGYQQMAVL